MSEHNWSPFEVLCTPPPPHPSPPLPLECLMSTGSSDCTVRVWQPVTGKNYATFEDHTADVVKVHKKGPRAVHV